MKQFKIVLIYTLQNRYASLATSQGLHTRHAYTITKVVELKARGKSINLVRVRNPHGNKNEWTGDWSDK